MHSFLTVPAGRQSFGGWVLRDPSASTSGYLVAFVALAVSLLFRYSLRNALGLKVPFLEFFLAIMVAALLDGLRPGLLVTGISVSSRRSGPAWLEC